MTSVLFSASSRKCLGLLQRQVGRVPRGDVQERREHAVRPLLALVPHRRGGAQHRAGATAPADEHWLLDSRQALAHGPHHRPVPLGHRGAVQVQDRRVDGGELGRAQVRGPDAQGGLAGGVAQQDRHVRVGHGDPDRQGVDGRPQVVALDPQLRQLLVSSGVHAAGCHCGSPAVSAQTGESLLSPGRAPGCGRPPAGHADRGRRAASRPRPAAACGAASGGRTRPAWRARR